MNTNQSYDGTKDKIFYKHINSIFEHRYHLQEEIGRSKMCVAYKADDTILQRSVAISTIQESLQENAHSKQMFFRTARIIAQFQHPNVVSLYDFGDANGFYMVTQFISGQTLASKIAEFCDSEKTLQLKEMLRIFCVICEAVEYIHNNKIIHGDLQSENIVIDTEDKPTLIGFGFAKMAESSEIDIVRDNTGRNKSSLNAINPL